MIYGEVPQLVLPVDSITGNDWNSVLWLCQNGHSTEDQIFGSIYFLNPTFFAGRGRAPRRSLASLFLSLNYVKMTAMKRPWPYQQISLLILALILGLIIGYHLKGTQNPGDKGSRAIRENEENYQFINPILFSGDSEALRSFKDLPELFDKYIKQNINNGNITQASVYYRELKSGEWTGLNENDKYAPASMYKVAVMIAVLKKAINSPHLLTDKVTVTQKSERVTVTVPQLIYAMIVVSDNEAKDILESMLTPVERQKVFFDFGLTPPHDDDIGDTISPKEYSLFFRVLYNANYLGHELSNKALEILTKTTFKDGLVAGIPNQIRVAHKYGYREFKNNNITPAELHDCGIVYTKNPYFICVMTKGKDHTKMAKVIAGLAKITYQYNRGNLLSNLENLL